MCSVCCDHYLLIVQQVTNTAHLSSTLPSDQLIKKARSHFTTLLRKQVESSREPFQTLMQKEPTLNNTKTVKKRWKWRATLDESPRSKDQWIQAILIGWKLFKLVPRLLDECPTPKSSKLRLNKLTWHLFWREKWIGLDQKIVLKRRASDLEKQESD